MMKVYRIHYMYTLKIVIALILQNRAETVSNHAQVDFKMRDSNTVKNRENEEITINSGYNSQSTTTGQEFNSHLSTFTEYEQHRDIFPITNDNFTSFVLKRKEPWVVIFHHDGHIITAWKTMAASMRGIFWVGVVSSQEDKVMQSMGFEASTAPPALVYPHGNAKYKLTHKEPVFTPVEAKNKATSSIPDIFKKVNAETLGEFMMDSFESIPSRFPALLLSSEATNSALYKALALRFQKYFNFGIMTDPSSPDISALGLQDHYFDLPSFLVMVTSEPIEPKISAVFYKKEEMGEINYPNLMSFLFYVNKSFRYLLPGDNKSNRETEAKMLDVIAMEGERFDFKKDKSDCGKRKSEL